MAAVSVLWQNQGGGSGYFRWIWILFLKLWSGSGFLKTRILIEFFFVGRIRIWSTAIWIHNPLHWTVPLCHIRPSSLRAGSSWSGWPASPATKSDGFKWWWWNDRVSNLPDIWQPNIQPDTRYLAEYLTRYLGKLDTKLDILCNTDFDIRADTGYLSGYRPDSRYLAKYPARYRINDQTDFVYPAGKRITRYPVHPWFLSDQFACFVVI